MRAAATRIPHASFMLVAVVGHRLPRDVPGQVAAQLIAFLAAAPTVPGSTPRRPLTGPPPVGPAVRHAKAGQPPRAGHSCLRVHHLATDRLHLRLRTRITRLDRHAEHPDRRSPRLDRNQCDPRTGKAATRARSPGHSRRGRGAVRAPGRIRSRVRLWERNGSGESLAGAVRRGQTQPSCPA